MSDCVNDFWNRVGKEQMAMGAGVSVRTKEIKEFQEGTHRFEVEDEEFESLLERVDNGDMMYQNMFVNMKNLLNDLSYKLTENEFNRFRDKIKAEFLEKLWH